MIYGVLRESVFSPGKVSEDAAILQKSLAELSRLGFRTRMLRLDEIAMLKGDRALVLSMAQSREALAELERVGTNGVRIVNSVRSVRTCFRASLIRALEDARVPMPSSRIVSTEGLERKEPSSIFPFPFWLKRGDVHAVRKGDVVLVESDEDLEIALRHYQESDIREVLLQEHVRGEEVKFYGVGKGAYFRAYRIPDGTLIDSPSSALVDCVRRAADAAGLEIYGGDLILTPSGGVWLVDLNDWPSFSRCCSSAAGGIASYVAKQLNGPNS